MLDWLAGEFYRDGITWTDVIYVTCGLISGELYIRSAIQQKQKLTVTGYVFGVLTGPLFLAIGLAVFLIATIVALLRGK